MNRFVLITIILGLVGYGLYWLINAAGLLDILAFTFIGIVGCILIGAYIVVKGGETDG